jgi:ABC-type enterochelin transport system permease subunit
MEPEPRQSVFAKLFTALKSTNPNVLGLVVALVYVAIVIALGFELVSALEVGAAMGAMTAYAWGVLRRVERRKGDS